jgi:hypothetical protein
MTQARAHTAVSGIAPAPRGGAMSTPGGRVMLIDLLRLVAAFQMVQGHAIDAVLAPAFRSGAVHGGWVWLRGLTSVGFLFVAGLSFHLATLRDLARHRGDPSAPARRFRRGAMLIALGYALHLPIAGVFGGGAQDAAAALQSAAIVDVLQCIGVCLLLLETLALVLPSRRAVELTCCALGAGVLALTPLLAQIDPRGPLLPLANYVTARGGSLFPLFPWGAHVLLGAGLCGFLLAPASPRQRGLRWLGAALLLLCAARAAALVSAQWADPLQRLGWVLAAGALLAQFEPAARAWPVWTRTLAGETLFLYAFHVLLVYGDGVGLGAVIGQRLAPLPAAALACVVLAASAACALSYERVWAGLARRTAPG